MSEDQASEPEAKPRSGRKWKLILMIGLPLLLLLGGGGAAYVMGMVPPVGGKVESAGSTEQIEDPSEIAFVDLPDLLVNLNVSGQRLRFLKLTASLEVHGADQAAIVRQLVPRILDSFQLYLRAIRPEELQGSEGAYRIKEDLLARTNAAVRPAEVRDVLVREMLVQ
jgi:flagellar FliL protein